MSTVGSKYFKIVNRIFTGPVGCMGPWDIWGAIIPGITDCIIPGIYNQNMIIVFVYN